MSNVVRINEKLHNQAVSALEEALFTLASLEIMPESMSDRLLAELFAHNGRSGFEYRK